MSTGIDATGAAAAIDSRLAQVLRTSAAACLRLPAPDEEVTMETLRERFGKDTIYKFTTNGILYKTRDVQYDAEYRCSGHLWGTSPTVYRWIQNNIDTETTPCGCSTGIRTVEAGELYTCKADDCDETFDRETALEVVE